MQQVKAVTLNTLAEFVREVTTGKTADEAGLAVLRLATDLLQGDECYLCESGADGHTLKVVVGLQKTSGKPNEGVTLPQSFCDWLAKYLRAEPGKPGSNRTRAAQFEQSIAPGETWMAAPVYNSEIPLLLLLKRNSQVSTSDTDLQLLQLMAEILAAALARTEAEEARRVAEQQLADTMQNSPVGQALVTPAGHLKGANRRLSEMLGYNREEMEGLSLRQLVVPEDVDSVIRSLNRTVSESGPLPQVEVRLLHQNGTMVYARFGATPLWDEKDKHTRTLIQVEDITAERRRAVVQQTFRTLGQKLLGAVTPQEVAEHVLQAADEMLQWNSSFIDLYSPISGEFEALLTIDEIDGQRVHITPKYKTVLPGSKTARALHEGAFLVLRRRQSLDDPNVIPFGNERPSASLMYVPMRRGEHNVGIFSIQSYRYDAYTEADLELLQELADFSSTSFERTFAERKAAEAEATLLENQKRFDIFMRATNDLIYDYNIVTGEIWWNEGARRILLGGETENRGVDWWSEQIHPEDRKQVLDALDVAFKRMESSWLGEYRFRMSDNTYGDFLDRGYILYEAGQPVRMIGSMMNISEQKRAQELLRHGAYHDSLTGLPNRAMVMEELGRSLARTRRRPDLQIGLLFLDLDRFKLVNDSLGHAAGDQLLLTVGQALKECVRPSDLVGRLGGDEFIVLLEDLGNEHDATAVAERILSRLREPFQIDGTEVFTGTSIGIAISSSRYSTPEEMLRDSDTAMYRAKMSGKGRFEIFDERMHAKVLSALQTEYDLRRAIQQNQFILHYQSLFDLESRKPIGFEALLRWDHPERGLLAPDTFIELAEETGLIIPIGEWVLRTACIEAMKWKEIEESGSPLCLSVNVSARQFAESSFVETVSRILEETGLPPSRLNLEITESILLEASAQRTQEFEQLRELGVRFHLDDFGSGYSSLNYLHQYPINVLKIDRSFISRFGTDQGSREIVKAILAMARVLELNVIGEGVETEEQMQLLRELGCGVAQGYLLHRPQPPELLRELLQWTSRPENLT